MIIAILIVLGLCFGSFVNALVWRVHEQAAENEKQKPSTKKLKELSVLNGRSMCTSCKHTLAAKDLLPVISWVSTKGKCRYCKKSISWQYPIVELVTLLLFVASYVWWPKELHGAEIAAFGLWLALLVGFMALIVYDLRWYLLPNRIVYPLTGIAVVLACVEMATAFRPGHAAVDTALAVLIGGGIFYALFQFSKGKWIGGGDVKLGWLLGLTAGTPSKSILIIFLASFIGVAVSLPLMQSKKLKASSVIPFGPFLIAAAIITQLFGQQIIHWYTRTFIG